MKDKLSFDLLSEERIKSIIKTEWFARKIYAFWSVGSTNEFAYRRALQGDVEGTLVIAEEQTRGRGRKSRHWHSSFNKGLWFSIILRPDLEASKVGLVSLFAGLSVAEAVENFCGLKPAVKWPNDLLLNGQKFCGILSDVEFKKGNLNFIILGIGINVNHKKDDFPEEFREQATSLRIVSENRVDRAVLLAGVLEQLEKNYTTIKSNGFNIILKKWKQRCPQFGQKIIVLQDNEKYEGKFEDLNGEGCLLLRSDTGELRRIVAGDILF